MANSDPVLILARDGHEFILEEADDFDKEVARLASREKFMSFLRKRAQEAGIVSLDLIEQSLK